MKFMKYKYLYFAVSLLVLIPGIYSLIRYGLRLSIDFTGGTLLEIQAPGSANFAGVSASQNLELYSVQSTGDNTYLLRFKPLTQEQNDQFKKALGNVSERRFETVGPLIGQELTRKAVLSIILASIFIILYIAWSFRSIPQPYASWKFGVSAVIALLHDAFVVLGIFSLFGHYFHVEIDSLFVTAILTVIGFSVHDTIVVFDRIRENLIKHSRVDFSQIVDYSVTETLNRSLSTSLTVTLTLTALLLFGGDSIRWFVVALLIGIVSGTYSSIFNAAPFLVLWESRFHNSSS
ncbi:protein translocase subunit SecF [Candidatus Amesbacteria bacterium]|nr:protein translocase subunit SecF [Candidatus Amesbacteria bacterium]